jgi:hypothetical protein
MQERDKYEAENLGHYRRVYPHPDPKQQEKYDKMLQCSVNLWNDYNGCRPREPVQITQSVIKQVNVPPPQPQNSNMGQFTVGYARTNADYFTKSKALDLAP